MNGCCVKEDRLTLKYLGSIVFVGIASGLSGMGLAWLLHFVQHLTFGYDADAFIGGQSFLLGVELASPARRLFVLTSCGLLAGVGWCLIHRYGQPLVKIEQAVQKSPHRMPILSTVLHVWLQIITVAMGSPLGREVAPRELSALIASWFCQKTALPASQVKILIACAAGAGLAAVYNVPLSGALFSLEVLLLTYDVTALIPALITSGIAVMIAWLGLGNRLQYHLPVMTVTPALIACSVLFSPVIGIFARWFKRLCTAASKKAPTSQQLLILLPLNFFMIGVLAIAFPALLGNGKSPAQLEFSGLIGLNLTATFLMLRIFIVWSSLRTGAHGGLLTPSLANGALLGALLGGMVQWVIPSFSVSTFAVVGAATFLATAQNMPLTAIVLIIELTHPNLSIVVPLSLMIAGALISEKRLLKNDEIDSTLHSRLK